MLGFLDDVFDIRWRHKLPIPIIASIPLLMDYAEQGNTNVVVPIPLRFVLGKLINLGERLSHFRHSGMTDDWNRSAVLCIYVTSLDIFNKQH